jgi:hypothetical protein
METMRAGVAVGSDTSGPGSHAVTIAMQSTAIDHATFEREVVPVPVPLKSASRLLVTRMGR